VFFAEQGPTCFFRQVLALLFAQKAEVEFHENVREKDKTGKS